MLENFVKEDALVGTDTITHRQFLAMSRCTSCFNELRSDFLYEHPNLGSFFKNLNKLSDEDFSKIAPYAMHVLESSEHDKATYGGYYDFSDPYMQIKGFSGVYVAFNNDVHRFFTRLKDAVRLADANYDDFMRD
jgi:hypothetical protein